MIEAHVTPPDPEPLPRTTFVQPDGRRIHVYGEVRGTPPADAPRSEPTALHMRRDELSASWVAVSPARNVRPHSSAPSGSGAVPGSPAEAGRKLQGLEVLVDRRAAALRDEARAMYALLAAQKQAPVVEPALPVPELVPRPEPVPEPAPVED